MSIRCDDFTRIAASNTASDDVQWLNYLSGGVGALPIQWPMVKIRQFRWHAKSRLCTHVK